MKRNFTVKLFSAALLSLSLLGGKAIAQTTFNNTGALQTYTVPAGVTVLTIDMTGAQGHNGVTTNGGNGGRVQATLAVTPGEVLNLYVGGQNGYNGGGISTGTGNGGGGTDIRVGGIDLTDRVMIAGGGGGGTDVATSTSIGGAGGDTAGGVPTQALDTPVAQGGTQSAGGAGGSCNQPLPSLGLPGVLGIGGSGGLGEPGGGGGGGYYGGGGAGGDAGAGGSSYVDSAIVGSITMTQGYEPGDGYITITPCIVPATITLPDDTAVCANAGFYLSANSGTGLTYSWLNTDTANNVFSINDTITTTGSYQVIVSNGTCSDTSAAVAVTINPLPDTTLTITGGTSLCNGSSVTLNLNACASCTFQWYNGTNTVAVTTNTYTTDSAGNYYAVITSAAGCSDTTATTVVIAGTLADTTHTVFGPLTFCAGTDSTTISVNSCTGCTYQWYDGSTPLTVTKDSLVATATGSYYVVITSATGCNDTSATTVVTVNPLPDTTMTTSGSTTVCTGDSVTLTLPATAGYTYQWWEGTSAINGATNNSFTAHTPDTYFAIITNSFSCSDTSSVITVISVPFPDTTATITGPTTTCVGTGNISVPTCTGCTYQWFDNNALTTTTTATFFPSVTGNVFAIITNSNGCSDTSSSYAFSIIATPHIDSVTASGAIAFCLPDSVTLTMHVDTANNVVYSWENANDVISGATDSTYTASVTGAYRAIATNSLGCSDTAIGVSVTALEMPVSSITVTTDTVFCQGNSVILHGHPTSGVTYQWFQNGAIAPGISTGVSYTATDAGLYTLQVTNGGLCSDSSGHINVIVDTLPLATITYATADTFCQGDTLVMSASTGTGYTYKWQKNNVNITPAATTATYKATATGNYRVLITNSNGCTDTSAAVPVFVKPLPTATITNTTGTTFCLGGNVVLHGPTTANDAYQWNRGGSPIPDATDANYTADTTGAYTVTVTDTLTGCSATTAPPKQVTVNQPPSATIIDGSATSFCLYDSVVFTASTTTPTGSTITHYAWSNNGTAITGATSATYTAYQQGAYTVTVTNSNNCKDTSAADTVVVFPLPPSTATATGDTAVCPGNVVVMNANIDTGLTYQWMDNLNNIGGANSTTYIASTSGSYTVVTTDYHGCMDTSDAVNVVIDTPVATITPSLGPTAVCQGNTVVLNANTGTNFTYQWELNGDPIPNANGSIYTAGVQGSYTVSVTNATGCVATSDSFYVTIFPLPTVSVSAIGAPLFCAGDSATLVATGDSIASYQWYNGPTPVDGATDSTYTATVTGDYTVVVTNSYGCSVASTPLTITANTVPAAMVTPEGLTTVCPGGSLVLDANPGVGYTYQWYLNDTAISGANGQTYTATQSGSYTVFIMTGANCTSLSGPLVVTVYAQPVVAAQNPIAFCFGSSVNLFANTSVPDATGFGYQWQNNGNNIFGATDSVYNAYMAGTYSCTTTAPNGCVSDATPVTITVYPLPEPVITLNGFVLSTGTFVTYQWYKDHVAIPGATSQSVTIDGDGSYYVSVSDNNGCVSVSDVYVLNNLNVNNVQGIADAIKVYPNPANTTVHIDAPVDVNITINSLDGKTVMTKANVKDIDVSKLVNGVYTISVYNKDGALLKIDKLVKTAD